MTNIVVNGAPHAVDLYTKDSSLVVSAREAEAIPQHCPKVFLFAERGTESEWLGGGAERERQYGAITFDERSRFFTHATQLANVVNAQGNICMYKRVVPQDAGPQSNYTLWADVLFTTVDKYELNSDFSIKLVNGQPTVIGQIPGVRIKFVKTFTNQEDQTFGIKTQQEGDQIDSLNPQNRSVRYPILERKASSRGAWGNNVGDRFWAMDARLESIPEKMVQYERAFPFMMKTLERDTRLNTETVSLTALGDQTMLFTLKPGTIDPSTDRELYLADTFGPTYNQTDTRYPVQTALLNGLAIYQDNIDELLERLHALEAPHIGPDTHDFTADPSDKYLYNLFSGTSLDGIPYRSYVQVEGGYNLNRYETLFADGGSDGTMNAENFEKAVIAEVKRYGDDFDEIQDKAYHVESCFYDTGYSLETKMALAPFISIRGDLFLTLSTFQEGERSFDNAEELSIAQALKSRLSNLPESVYFGTPVLRAAIYGGDCKLRSSRTGKRVSTVMEVAHKRARYMGASNGRWKTGLQYDQGSPGSLAEITSDYSKLWVPVKVRYRFWDTGLNWWGRYDRSQVFCPAFRTVYEYEYSILTSETIALAICELNKVNDRSWRAHSGTVGQSDAVFTERVAQFIRDNTRDRFDNRFPIEPNIAVTESDKARGSISWNSGIKIFGDAMRTVAINYTEAFRNES